MSKGSFATLLAVLLAAGIAYLAFDPDAARDLSNWVRAQVDDGSPTPKLTGHPNYTPVIPGKGL